MFIKRDAVSYLTSIPPYRQKYQKLKKSRFWIFDWGKWNIWQFWKFDIFSICCDFSKMFKNWSKVRFFTKKDVTISFFTKKWCHFIPLSSIFEPRRPILWHFFAFCFFPTVQEGFGGELPYLFTSKGGLAVSSSLLFLL